MKKFSLLFVLAALAVCTMNAQSLSKNDLTYLYTRQPLIPLEGVDSYYITLKIDTIQNKFLKETFEQEIAKNLWMNGLKKTTGEGLEIIVNLKPHDAYKKMVQHSSDANKVTNRVFHKYSIKYEVLLPETKKTALRWTLDPGYSSYYMEWISSVPGLDQLYINDINSGMILKKEELLKNVVKALGIEVRSFLDYTRVRGDIRLTSVKKHKNYNYSDLNVAVSSAKEALSMMKVEYQSIPENVAKKLDSGSIQVWKKALNELDIDNKKARINKKVAGALYENLYITYTRMSEFSFAEQTKMEFESKLGKPIDAKLVAEFEDMKRRFDANNSK